MVVEDNDHLNDFSSDTSPVPHPEDDDFYNLYENEYSTRGLTISKKEKTNVVFEDSEDSEDFESSGD